jgi:galactokinase
MVYFKDIKAPLVDGIAFDLANTGLVLCIVNTGGSHANLTPDYALIPNEMKSVAAFFGKETLREVEYTKIIDCGNEIRESCGDRAMLRAIHYFNENQRVDVMAKTLRKISAALNPDEKERYTRHFLELVNESGHSSWELLQNVYTEKNVREQRLSLALVLTRDFGACRVHGGGFAETIQAYIPQKSIRKYLQLMEKFFGKNSVTTLRIRPIGVARLFTA